MKTRIAAIVIFPLLALAIGLGSYALSTARAAEEKSAGPMLVHNVFFSLKDNSDEAKKEFIASCHEWLSGHPGTVLYSSGLLADIKAGNSDRDFDVGLTLVFKDRAAFDTYMPSERHKKFIAENIPKISKVRAFDFDGETVSK